MSTSLDKFFQNNPQSNLIEKDDHFIIEKAWNDKTFFLRLKKDEDFNSFEKIILPKELSALFHFEDNKYEFIFCPLKSNDDCISRIFEFVFEGKVFKAYFGEPSDVLVQIAKSFIQLDGESGTEYRNLKIFRDYYKQDKLPEFVKKYFEDKVPINFFIEGPFDSLQEHLQLFRHLNFYMDFFDRGSPHVLIHDFEDSYEAINYERPCLSKENGFPSIISMKEIDHVLLGLMDVARSTQTIRLKYIFYFQILEYCSYYYLNGDLKRKLNNIVKNPDLLNDSDKYSQYIIEEFKNYFKSNDDTQKLEKVIIDFCEYTDIKNEILSNADYFVKDLVFDGGFSLPGLFKNRDEIEAPAKNIMVSIKANIEKIRNVLVHIRESRENKIILPTERNNRLLIPYLYLIRRIAELVAIKYE